VAFAALKVGERSVKALEILRRYEAGATQMSDDDRAFLDAELSDYIRQILRCKDFESAQQLFTKLGDLHLALATLAFKYDVKLTQRQREFVREFDRWDDSNVLASIFQKIKNQQFPWQAEN